MENITAHPSSPIEAQKDTLPSAKSNTFLSFLLLVLGLLSLIGIGFSSYREGGKATFSPPAAPQTPSASLPTYGEKIFFLKEGEIWSIEDNLKNLRKITDTGGTVGKNKINNKNRDLLSATENKYLFYLQDGDIWRIKDDLSEKKQLTQTNGEVCGFGLSPNEAHLRYDRYDSTLSADMNNQCLPWVIDINGSNPVKLEYPDDEWKRSYPDGLPTFIDWSPDGNLIINLSAPMQIAGEDYEVGVDGKIIGKEAKNDGSIVWYHASPPNYLQSQYRVWVDTATHRQVWFENMRDSSKVKIYEAGSGMEVENISWSNDSKMLALAEDSTGSKSSGKLVVVDLKGAVLFENAENEGGSFSADKWSSDNSKIIGSYGRVGISSFFLADLKTKEISIFPLTGNKDLDELFNSRFRMTVTKNGFVFYEVGNSYMSGSPEDTAILNEKKFPQLWAYDSKTKTNIKIADKAYYPVLDSNQ